MRILDADDVDAVMDETMVLEAMRELFSLPQEPTEVGVGRIDLAHPNGWLRALPAFITGKDLLGYKVLHRTSGTGMRYTTYVHRLGTGELIGIVDALEATNLRTGAVSALATEHLGRDRVEVAAIVGTGPVARGQLRAIELVRPATETRVFARTPENRRSFVKEMSGFVTGRLAESATLDEALRGADLITLATKAASPVLRAEHLHPGVHVNSVGPASRDRVEVDPAMFRSFDLIVCDTVELVFAEAGDAHGAVADHAFDSHAASDLSAVVSGSAPARTSVDDITLFKSVGTGAQDLIVAARLLERAEDADVGTVVGDVNSIKPSAGPG